MTEEFEPQKARKKYPAPYKLPQILLCRICQKEIIRDGFTGRPKMYCCEQHQREWRNEYRRIWQQKYEARKRKSRLVSQGFKFKKVEENGKEFKIAA